MGETYDSLGSRVVRHFRHYIDGSRHVWLKGNYMESDTNIRDATSNLKALPPVTMETSECTVTNSFLPISKAPVTNSSSECLKPKPIPAKTLSCDIIGSDESKLPTLVKQDTIELPLEPS